MMADSKEQSRIVVTDKGWGQTFFMTFTWLKHTLTGVRFC